ncbi:low density lipoprotein receptor adapter protein 1-like isoform X1 [Vidua macroura]|uniref:low density lipoprotein receptor adapter protein 1-like isoform X1 n=1 Tax=Vidua macroura TaxID=187451 RepID=UPI0023A83A33|nr:low density lipoprotein receptor adapter protein 1-like isoform X1 [Vidua macroura]
MEALRAAGRAVLRSPRLARHGLGLRRRRKLPESWADMQEPLLEGMCFTLKYLGMTLVEKPKGEDMAAAAIRRIVATDSPSYLLPHLNLAGSRAVPCHCMERRVKYWERWGLSLPVYVAVSRFEEYSVQGMPDCQTLLSHPYSRSLCSKYPSLQRLLVFFHCQARVGARKFQKVILTVSPRGISLQDADTKEMVENISIYRISYCTTDKLQNKVFAYVAQSQESGALECHAFLSPKKKIAQAVTLTVAQAFQMALDLWEATHAGSRQDQPLHPSCVLESSEASRPREPAPPGTAPFTHHVGEEEEEEEDDNVSETLSGINTSCAPIELSYSTATVLPPGATPGQLDGAGRGWRLPQHWHQDCWPQDSPGLSQISATMDQPLRIHPVPAPGPASACRCPSTALLAWGLLALLPWSAQAAAPAPCPVPPA